MSYMITPVQSALALSAATRPFGRMLTGMLEVLSPRRPGPAMETPAPAGPAIEALIDADYERMAGFGSWAALRDNLRASATAPVRKCA